MMASYRDMDWDTRPVIVWELVTGWHNEPDPHGGLWGIQAHGPVLCLWQEAIATGGGGGG